MWARPWSSKCVSLLMIQRYRMRYNGAMRWFAAAAGLALATGCASSVPNVEDQPLFAAGWSGPPPHVAVQVTGTGGPTEQQRCVDAVKGAGAVVDAAAPVQALV